MVPLNPAQRAAAVAAFDAALPPAEVRPSYTELLGALEQALRAHEAANPERWFTVAEGLPDFDPLEPFVWATWSGTAVFPHAPRQGKARYVPGLGWQPEGALGFDWNVTHWKYLPRDPNP